MPWYCSDAFSGNTDTSKCVGNGSELDRISSLYAFPVTFSTWVGRQFGDTKNDALDLWWVARDTEYPTDGYCAGYCYGYDGAFKKFLNEASGSWSWKCNLLATPAPGTPCTDALPTPEYPYSRHAGLMSE